MNESKCFYRIIALLAHVFKQIVYLSLRIFAYCKQDEENPYEPAITGQIIQEKCLNRLRGDATYNLYLNMTVEDDKQERTVIKSFLKSPFVKESGTGNRPLVVIREHSLNNDPVDVLPAQVGDNSEFCLYTVPYRCTDLSSMDLPDQQ